MSAPVGYTCGDIDNALNAINVVVIKKLNEQVSKIDEVISEIEDDELYTTLTDVRNEIEKASDILYDIELESLRKQNQALREWGESLEGQVEDLKWKVEDLEREMQQW
jgi:predicted nuclease with TOPRIM domain